MTTYDRIKALKPKSIFDVVPQEVFLERDDPKHPHIRGRNCYEWKYAVAKLLQPKRILEIGVRYGYSLASFIAGAPSIEYAEGWDNLCYDPESNAKATEALSYVIRDVIVVLEKVDSQEVQCLNASYDVVHIDSSHTYAGCTHDLNLCLGHTKAILIDDFDGCPDDRKACLDFVERNRGAIAETVALPSVNGDLLILFKGVCHGGNHRFPFPEAGLPE